MNYAALLDPVGAGIVLGGTALAVLLGSGRRELGAMLVDLARLLRPRFDPEAARAEIARDVEAMRNDGLLRAQPVQSSDEDIVAATDALVHDRSPRSLVATHEVLLHKRVEARERGLRPLRLAAELAPVFGMAGTLFALSQMQIAAGVDSALLVDIGMAILTTLYGLLLAHLLLHPVARLIERRGAREDADRREVIDWLARQLTLDNPRRAAKDDPPEASTRRAGEPA